MHCRSRARARLAALASILCACAPGSDGGSWPVYGADGANTRYSPLGEIRAENFARLEPAWSWRSHDLVWQKAWEERWGEPPGTDITDFQLSPLVVGQVLFGVTPLGYVFALEADTGRRLWVTDLEAYRIHRDPKRAPGALIHRGVAYWREGNDERIYALAFNAYLVALDARTGRPVASFGRDGRVDVLDDLPGKKPQHGRGIFQKSPPAIVGNTIVVGSSVADRPMQGPGIRGDVRGYDVRSGAHKWTFHTVPLEGEEGVETWERGSWRGAGAANVWAVMSVDEELGAVYLATSAPTNDYYGGHRPGDNLFSQTLLCLDGETGRKRWHQQLVRHDLWDYDLAAPPNLLDIEVEGRAIRAVAQVTKQGDTFVFDRVTGAPVWPIEERAVPGSDVPGERAATSQRFPMRPPPFEERGASESNLVDFTPELRAAALEVFRRYRTGPVFTPPSLGGTLSLPGPSGGANWQGAAVDPETATLFVPSINLPAVMSVVPGPKRHRGGFRYVTGMTSSLPTWVDGVPMFKPPYSRITAIDLNRGEIRWQVANGDGPRDAPALRDVPDLPRLGSQARTCVLATAELLIAGDGAEHNAASLGEPLLHAYSKADGSLVASVPLPGQTTGCPISYKVDGRQYVVVATGGMRFEPVLVALRVPEAAR